MVKVKEGVFGVVIACACEIGGRGGVLLQHRISRRALDPDRPIVGGQLHRAGTGRHGLVPLLPLGTETRGVAKVSLKRLPGDLSEFGRHGSVPNFETALVFCSDEQLSIRAEGHTASLEELSAEAQCLLARRYVPDAHAPILADGSEPAAIVTEGDVQNRTYVPRDLDELFSTRGVPHADGLVFAG
jgi:hypothetical protein